VIATGLCSGVGSLTVDGDTLYFVDGTHAFRLSTSGGAPTQLLDGGAGTLALDGNSLLVATRNGIARLPKSGGAATSLITFSQDTTDSAQWRTAIALASDGTSIYFATADTYRLSASMDKAYGIWRADHADGGNLTQLTYGRTNALVADGSALYSVESFDGLVRRDVACVPGAATAAAAASCAPRLFAPPTSGFIGDGDTLAAWDGNGLAHIDMNGGRTALWSHAGITALDSDAGAWFATDGSALWRVPRDGSAPSSLVATSGAAIWLDDDNAYVAGATWPTMLRVPKLGGASTTVVTSPNTRFFGVDARGVYGLEEGATTNIWRHAPDSSDTMLVSEPWHSPNLNGLLIAGDEIYATCYNAYGTAYDWFALFGPADPHPCYGVAWGGLVAGGLAVVDGETLKSVDLYGEGPGAWTNNYDVTVTRADGTGGELRVGHYATGAAITTDSYIWQTDAGVERVPRTCGASCVPRYTPSPPPQGLGCSAAPTDGGTPAPPPDGGTPAPPPDGGIAPPPAPPVGGTPASPDGTTSNGPPPNAASPATDGCAATPGRPAPSALALPLLLLALAAVARRRAA
jgi:hypothetical protein